MLAHSTARTLLCPIVVALVTGVVLGACKAEVRLPELSRTDAAVHVGDPDSGTPSDACEGKSDGTACGDGKHCIKEACLVNTCGDGVRAGDEQCDDGAELLGDGCSPACRLVPDTCGDGRVDEGEECDDGDLLATNDCSNACTQNICGNRRRDPGEECDDGNVGEEDHCSNACTRILCRNGRLDPGEQCDDGNNDDRDGCTNGCLAIRCGDGIVHSDHPLKEECDDGNSVNDDGCSNTCRENHCGNGRVDPGEVCDGNSCSLGDAGVSGSVCNANCSACEDDGCEQCLQAECGCAGAECQGTEGYNGIDLYTPCRIEATSENTLYGQGAPPSESFTQDCSSLYQCMRFSPCAGLSEEVSAKSYQRCTCSDDPLSVVVTECTDFRGACTQELVAATECPAADPACALGANLSDLVRPSGYAYFLLTCMQERCGAQCGFSSAL